MLIANLYTQDGCTDASVCNYTGLSSTYCACNYNPDATQDDGSCFYPTSLNCYNDFDSDGFYNESQKYYTCDTFSCFELGETWSDDPGYGLDGVPTPPVIPELQAVSSNEEIILMWDNKAESSIDPFTGYSDFEGYRIYRSSDGGHTWGKSWNRIYDYSGNHVAWKPIAQFDLIEESDSLHCVYSNG